MARTVDRSPIRHEPSLTYSITHERRINDHETRFRAVVEQSGLFSWMGVMRQIHPLHRRAIYGAVSAVIHLSMADQPYSSLVDVSEAFNEFAASLKPDQLTLEITSDRAEELRRRLSDARKNPYSTLIWEQTFR